MFEDNVIYIFCFGGGGLGFFTKIGMILILLMFFVCLIYKGKIQNILAKG